METSTDSPRFSGILFVSLSPRLRFSQENAAPLHYSADTTISLTSPAVNFTIASGSVADTLVVNATSVAVTLSHSTGGSFTLTSASRDLSVVPSSAGGTVSQSCASGVASVTISQSTGSSNYTIAPTAAACTTGPVTVGVGRGYGVPYVPGVGPITTSSASSSSSASLVSAATSATAGAGTTAPVNDLLAQISMLIAKLRALLAQLVSQSGNLALWSYGNNVKDLQLFLVYRNAGPAASKLARHGMTRTFGMLTYAALIEYQRSAGLPPTGYFGPMTRRYLAALEAR